MTKNDTHKKRFKTVLKKKGSVALLGIGGIGMSALASLLQSEGIPVVGFDRKTNDETIRLIREGISVTVPEGTRLPDGIDALVYSLAVDKTHPLLLDAIKKGLPILSRAELLSLVTEGYEKRIVVAGTHGKSTVTSMLAKIFSDAGKKPTVLCGAKMENGSPFLRGDRKLLILEGCEYKRAFLSFQPTTAVLLNAEWDHPDVYKSKEEAQEAFNAFLSLPTVKLCVTGEDIKKGAVFSLHKGDLYARDLSYIEGCGVFTPIFFGTPLPRLHLSVLGEHNVKNALAALLVALLLGVSPEKAIDALSRFGGAGRRMEYKGSLCDARVYDDYAHHPTEIRAAVSAARKITRGKLILVFESHTYSRTAAFFKDFAEALKTADVAFVADIFAAREKNESGVSGKALAEAASGIYIENEGDFLARIESTVEAGDTVLFCTAGDFSKIIAKLPLEM